MKVAVLLPKIFNHPFTYSTELKGLKTGDFIIVPFGKTQEIGVIWDKIQPTVKNIKLRNVGKKINNIYISKNLVKFINWFSMYNMVSKGMVLKMCLGDKKNILKIEEQNLEKKIIKENKYILNQEQKESLNKLRKFSKSFNVSVLQGVTGSGKTLVYFERIKDIIKKQQQVLILLPEIFLTNQFKSRCVEYFGFEPGIWHSKITPKNKRNIWQEVINNKTKLIIGARSSLLLPFKKLGLIIVDEEHDSSYKQDEGLIYNARDMAISRASFENIPIHLVTSIPSLETYNHIKNKKYNITKIEKRFSNFPLPDTKIVNLNFSKLKKNEFIADETLELVNSFLKKNEQILFFLNRRGYAPFMVCKICGFKHTCPDCSIYLTYHKLINKLICHHCGYKIAKERKCKIKENYCNFNMYGPGVEKIFEELKLKIPKKNIKIFSSDFLSRKKNTEDFLEQVEKNKINILVGTQMISKGFNFPKLNCIVVVDADFSGKGYDLRTTEKNIQLYNQLSGRAGRFSKKSLIVYQTMTPSNETLKDVLKNNPEKFLFNELILRKTNRLPPYYRLISLIISSNSDYDSLRGGQEIKKKLLSIKDMEVLGPVDSPIFKIKKKYRTRLLIRSQIDDLIQKKLAVVLENIQISKRIKLTVDVDPINFT
ncbi:MAG: primosomal protein N' (replication factor Y) (superfamily II helicase) [Pelagibacterales bacterium]|nr:primosomal protein N' (replication factor Y) (superfamily II helicase) [Pelagibacterales bacterium]